MTITRRGLLHAGVASAIVARISPAHARIAHETTPLSGWHTLKLGPGGLQTNIQIADDGTKFVRTDVGGAYVRTPSDSTWRQVCTLDGFGVESEIGGALGVWAIAIAPSDSNRLYMAYTDSTDNRKTCVYRSTDRGTTWTRLANSPIIAIANHTDPGSMNKLQNHKLVVDPNNPDAVYYGVVAGVGFSSGYFRTLDGGDTWSAIADIPNLPQSFDVNGPYNAPMTMGGNGICFDRSSGTTSFRGAAVTKRILAPVSSHGVYESHDGGEHFNSICSDPTPPTTLTLNTSIADSVIIVQVLCYETTMVTGVTLDGRPMRRRAQGFMNVWFLYEFYSTGPLAAAAHSIEVSYLPGARRPKHPTGMVGAFGVTGVDNTDASTIFSSAVRKSNKSRPPSITARGSTNLVFALTLHGATIADPGWSLINNDASNGFMSEYRITSGFSRITPQKHSRGYGWILDAVRQKAGGKLAIDGTAYGSSPGSNGEIAPFYVQSAQICDDGTAWFVDSAFGHTDGSIFRYWFNGRSYQWDRMSGSGGLGDTFVHGAHGAIMNVSVSIDPRDSSKIWCAGAAPVYGYNSFNANLPKNQIKWGGSTGGNRPLIASTDIPWQSQHNLGSANIGSLGNMVLDRTDGKLWLVNGIQACYFDSATLNYTSGAPYSVAKNVVSAGIEELVVQAIIDPPNCPNPLVVVEDRYCFRTNMPDYPTRYAQAPHHGNAWHGDFAWNNPGYIAVVHRAGAGPRIGSSYTTDYGHTWMPFVHDPMPNNGNLNGNVAVGSFTGALDANLVAIVRQSGSNAVVWSEDNGTTAWKTSAGVPNVRWFGASARSVLLVADRDAPGTFYLAANGFGILRSTDKGHSFRPYIRGLPRTGAAGYVLCSVPGTSGDLLVTPRLNYGHNGAIYYSTGGGALKDFSRGQITGVWLIAVGKKVASGSYPTVFALGVGPKGFGCYYSTDKGVSWILAGTPRDWPKVSQMNSPLVMGASWNTDKKFYLGFSGAGVAQWQP